MSPRRVAADDQPKYSPVELADALGLFAPTDEQAAVIAAPPGPLVVIAGAGAGKTETMAARVVWLVANGYAEPNQVLGLTFTRKAAGQLLRRVRSRLARLAGLAAMPPAASVAGPATVSTYHAFAGTLLRDHGLLLPMEPDTRLIGETELWQLAFRVVCDYPGPLDTEKDPAAITAMVLRLSGQLAEHLVNTDQLVDTHAELERLILTLPPGPRQRGPGPNQALLRLLSVQTERAALVPIVDALHQRMRVEKVMDFGQQMGAAARLASAFPRVGEQLRHRYRVVLLDEYQDTGHAQRVALSALFGGGVDGGLALTAVGDPIQSIYGWRGASATNLPRFTTDFPRPDATPAPTLELRTSWRNPPETLRIANAVSEEARRRTVSVRELLPRPSAPEGRVECALLDTVADERLWVAEHLAARFHGAADAGQAPPTAAVLMRRNADAGPMAAQLEALGVPVEVVGLAGLLSISEVADVVAMVRLVADPTAGPAAMRVLTGPRWRLGARDLEALWRRALELDRDPAGPGAPNSARQLAATAADRDAPCLADAICDPGPARAYSDEGFRRLVALSRELTALRSHLWHPLTDLVAEVRRTAGVDVEARAAQDPNGEWSGGEHLDAFADVVSGYADHREATVAGLLAYLDDAAVVENGLSPAEVSVAPGRVQIMTVHAAKGLEWQVVAVPHLVGRVFPSTASHRTWLSDPSELPPLLRGDRADVGVPGVPVLDTAAVSDRKALADTIFAHKAHLDQRRMDEERRLLYVAITRAEDTLLVSGHHWGAAEAKPRGPSEFLTELKGIIDDAAATGTPCGVIDRWTPAPPDGTPNPLRDNVVEAVWPVEPLGSRDADVRRGAALVAEAMACAENTPEHSDADPEGWAADVDALLAERERSRAPEPVALPKQLSVSSLVELSRDPDSARQRLARRLPARPDPNTLLGTAFHDWVQRFYGADRLFDLDDLPGTGGDVQPAGLERLQDAFNASQWATRIPVDVEVPFEMAVGDTVLRGRIDAVFADQDGGVTVVDWKTGEPPADEQARRHAEVQLAVYRLAWAALSGLTESAVRVAFHYVRSNRTVIPADVPTADDVVRLLEVQQR
ncbi:MAG: ATP-dependent helicase [Mycobacterium sp.]